MVPDEFADDIEKLRVMSGVRQFPMWQNVPRSPGTPFTPPSPAKIRHRLNNLKVRGTIHVGALNIFGKKSEK